MTLISVHLGFSYFVCTVNYSVVRVLRPMIRCFLVRWNATERALVGPPVLTRPLERGVFSQPLSHDEATGFLLPGSLLMNETRFSH